MRLHPVFLLIGLVAAIASCGSSPATGAAQAIAPGAVSPVQTNAVVDQTRLPLGDGKTSSSSAAPRTLMTCMRRAPNGGGAAQKGPWFNPDGLTWDRTKKLTVDGHVSWPGEFSVRLQGDRRLLVGNDLPNDHTTGTYPIAATDDVAAYDRNPNRISPQTISVELPANPTVNAKPTCTGGTVGILTSGVWLFNALDAELRDAPAWESQDSCQGHPERTGEYHYHDVSACIADPGSGHSSLVGWALDGFGIFGHRGVAGKELTDDDLDECHGHTHEIDWDGKLVTMYHYHATYEFPYTVGCYRGTPVVPAAG